MTCSRDTFDQLHAEGAESRKTMSVALHARLLGRPGRIGALHRILDHVMGHEGVRIARRDDIARHWQTHHPDPRREGA